MLAIRQQQQQNIEGVQAQRSPTNQQTRNATIKRRTTNTKAKHNN
jgi:hypothetical protein